MALLSIKQGRQPVSHAPFRILTGLNPWRGHEGLESAPLAHCPQPGEAEIAKRGCARGRRCRRRSLNALLRALTNRTRRDHAGRRAGSLEAL